MGPLLSGSILMYYDYRVLNQSYYLIAMPQVWIFVQQNSSFLVFLCVCVWLVLLLHKLIVNGFTTVNTGNLLSS